MEERIETEAKENVAKEEEMERKVEGGEINVRACLYLRVLARPLRVTFSIILNFHVTARVNIPTHLRRLLATAASTNALHPVLAVFPLFVAVHSKQTRNVIALITCHDVQEHQPILQWTNTRRKGASMATETQAGVTAAGQGDDKGEMTHSPFISWC